MLSLSASALVSSSAGATLEDPATGLSLTLPPHAFLNERGAPFEGDAMVLMAAIDPSDPTSLGAMPGDFSGAVDVLGNRAALRSYGAVWIDATDPTTGKRLTLSDNGGSAEVSWDTRVATDCSSKGGALPSVWMYDEAAGVWTQGRGELSVDGETLPSPSSEMAAAFAAAGAPLTSPQHSDLADVAAVGEEGQTVQAATPPLRGMRGKKGKGTREHKSEIGRARAAQHGEAHAQRFLSFFASSKGKRLRMLLGAGKLGWFNCDAPYLQTMVRGRVAGWIDRASSWRTVRAVARGLDYASWTYGTIDASGGFSMVVQVQSRISIELQAEGLPDPKGDERAHICTGGTRGGAQVEQAIDVAAEDALDTSAPKDGSEYGHVDPVECVARFGPFNTKKLGEIAELGELRIE